MGIFLIIPVSTSCLWNVAGDTTNGQHIHGGSTDHDHGHSHPHSHGAGGRQEVSSGDQEKIRSTLKQFVRDWSEEVREYCSLFCHTN